MLSYQLIPVTSFQQNCSLVWCNTTREAVFIDPGGNVELLVNKLNEADVKLKGIWLTHGHLDHIGASSQLRDIYGVPVTGPHIDDEFLFDAIPVQCQMFQFDMIEPFKPDFWLEHGQVLKLGVEQFEVLHTPGHTPGHVVLKHPHQKLLWVGDVLFHNSIGRTDFPRGNHNQLISSIRNHLLSLDDDYHFIPGHGPESSIGYERINNPFIV